jgi:hypothetical protein
VQVWLARGDLDSARGEPGTTGAGRYCRRTKPAGGRPRLLAEIALQGGHLSDAEGRLREAQAAIQACDAPLLEWRIAATAARVHGRQRRRANAQTERLRCAALVKQLADSLPPGHELRRSFLEHASLREVLRSRAGGPRS